MAAEKLQFASFVIPIIGTPLLLLSGVLGYFGTGLSDKGYWEAIRLVRSEIKESRVRRRPKTPF